MPSAKEYEMLFKLNAQQNSGFKNAFSQAQAEFARLGSEIQSLNRLQGDIASYQKQQAAMENTRAKIGNLTREHDALQEELAASARQEELFRRQIEESTGDTSGLEQELAKAAQNTAQLKGENVKLEERIRSTNVNLENQQGRLSATEERLKKAGVSTADLAGKNQELTARIQDLHKRQEEAARSAEEYGQSAASAFETAGTALAAAGLVGGMKELAGAYLDTVRAAGDFQYAMSQTAALSGAGGGDLASLSATAKEMGAATKFTAQESAQAFQYMALAGWDTQSMLQGISPVLNLATAANMDLAQASDIVTDYLTAFGLSANDTAGFVDILAYAMANSNTNVAQLGEAYKNVASTAKSMGFTVEDTTAAIMTMANAGVKGGEAGTALNAVMTRLATDTKGCAAELEQYGVHVYDMQGNMNSLSDILGGISGVWATLTDQQQANLAKTIAGTSQYSSLQTIMTGCSEAAAKTGQSFNDYAAALQNCNGSASRMSATMLDNLNGQLTLMQSAYDGLTVTVGELFLPQMQGLAEAGTDVLTWVNAFVEDHPVLAKAIMATTGVVGGLTTGIVAFNAAKKAAQAIDLAAMFAGPVGPVMLLLGGVTALATGLTGISDAALDTWPKVDELTKSAQGLDDALKSAAAGYKDSQTELAATAGMADHYISRLEALDGATSRTKEQQAEYHATLAMLAETVPELAGSIDLTTDSIEGGTAALRRQTEQWKENAKAQAYQETLKEIYAQQAQAELEHEQNIIKLQNAQADLRDIEEQRATLMKEQADLAQKYGFTYEEALNGTAARAGYSSEKIQELTDKHGQLEVQIHALDGELDKAQGAVGIYSQAVEKSQPVLDEAERQAEELAAALAKLSGEGKDAAAGLKDVQNTLTGVTDAFNRNKATELIGAFAELGVGLGSLGTEYKELYIEAYDSISGQIPPLEIPANRGLKWFRCCC